MRNQSCFWFSVSILLVFAFVFAAAQPVLAGGGGTTDGTKSAPKVVTGKKPVNPWGLPCKTYYTVKSGDLLYKIGEKYGISALALARLNQLPDANRIMPGTILCVKIPRAAGYLHVVATNERLADIAAKYNAKMDLILRANKLKDENAIRSGMVLYIPKSSKYVK